MLFKKFFFYFFLVAFSFSTAFAQQKSLADWTLIIFMSSDNDLSSAALDDIDEMLPVGSTERVNVVVFRDSLDQETSTKIFHIKKGQKVVVKDFKTNIDSGNWHELVDLFKLAQEKFPAQKYMLTVWNHGNGWEKSNKGIAYDESAKNNISTKQLGLALKEIAALRGKKIELFATDACLMQMVEVAYEFRDEVEFFAASEEVEPGQGWPYTEILTAITQKPQMSALEFGQTIARLYVDSYRRGTQEGDLATFSVISLPELKNAVETLPSFIQNMLGTQLLPVRLLNSISLAQSYDSPEYVDLFDFFSILRPMLAKNPLALEALTKSETAFLRAVKYEAHWGESVKRSKGISIWLPKNVPSTELISDYRTLDFELAVGWTSFIDFYFGK